MSFDIYHLLYNPVAIDKMYSINSIWLSTFKLLLIKYQLTLHTRHILIQPFLAETNPSVLWGFESGTAGPLRMQCQLPNLLSISA